MALIRSKRKNDESLQNAKRRRNVLLKEASVQEISSHTLGITCWEVVQMLSKDIPLEFFRKQPFKFRDEERTFNKIRETFQTWFKKDNLLMPMQLVVHVRVKRDICSRELIDAIKIILSAVLPESCYFIAIRFHRISLEDFVGNYVDIFEFEIKAKDRNEFDENGFNWKNGEVYQMYCF